MSQMTEAVAASPLANLKPLDGAMSLSERELCGKITIRGELSDAAFAAACEQVLGAAPQPTLAVPQNLEVGSLYWIGPNEWLLHCEMARTAELLAALSAAAGDAHMAVVDVTDYYVVMRLEGEEARAVLSRGTPLDVHPKVFLAGQAVSTRFAKCSVLLHAQNDQCFDLQVRWSHAEYLWQYLAQAASQYN